VKEAPHGASEGEAETRHRAAWSKGAFRVRSMHPTATRSVA